MNYDKLNNTMDSYIPSNFIKSTITKLATSPERLTGILHANSFELGSITSFGYSRNNSFGNAIEEVFREIVIANNWKKEPTSYTLDDHKLTIKKIKKKISVDQVFSRNNTIIFVEQKIRDDHDTSKWVGQWENFKYKLEVLTEIYNNKEVIGVMWMIDNKFHRNQDNYLQQIQLLDKQFDDKVFLTYGNEIDDIFHKYDQNNGYHYFDEFYKFISYWHNASIKIPDLNFDQYPDKVIQVFDDLSTEKLKKFLTNKDIISEVFPIIFKNKQVFKAYARILKLRNTTRDKEILTILIENNLVQK